MMVIPGMENGGGGGGGYGVIPKTPTVPYVPPPVGEPDNGGNGGAVAFDGGVITKYVPQWSPQPPYIPPSQPMQPTPTAQPASVPVATVSPCATCMHGSNAQPVFSAAPSASVNAGGGTTQQTAQAGFPWWILLILIFAYFSTRKKGA
jgi:hypothetical protein